MLLWHRMPALEAWQRLVMGKEGVTLGLAGRTQPFSTILAALFS
jgi:hypothetical protein